MSLWRVLDDCETLRLSITFSFTIVQHLLWHGGSGGE